jgi:ribosome-associated protein
MSRAESHSPLRESEPEDDPTWIAPGVRIGPGGMRIQYARSSGPGGQNVNKLNTRAELWVQVGAITGLTYRAIERLRKLAGARLTADDQIHLRAETNRSQESNRREVLDRLRQLILEARIEPKPRKKTKPSKAAKQRRVDSKRKRGEVKARRRGGDGEDWQDSSP